MGISYPKKWLVQLTVKRADGTDTREVMDFGKGEEPPTVEAIQKVYDEMFRWIAEKPFDTVSPWWPNIAPELVNKQDETA
jgi:hypothetical protein